MGYMGILFNIPKAVFYLLKGDYIRMYTVQGGGMLVLGVRA